MTTLRNARILELRAGGMKIRLIAAATNTSPFIVEHVLYGNKRPIAALRDDRVTVTVKRKCLRCREAFDAHPVIFRCDACKDATRGVCDAEPAILAGGSRGGRAE